MKLLQNAASKKAALKGSMLVIDPSSGGSSKKGEQSQAGFAEFYGGKLQNSGVLKFPESKEVYKRLRGVKSTLEQVFGDSVMYDLFVLEDIRGYRAQQSLIQSCGVFITNINSTEFFQFNVKSWKSIAMQWGGYVKSDENDAIYMGYATIAVALGYHSKLSPKKREEVINKAKGVIGYE